MNRLNFIRTGWLAFVTGVVLVLMVGCGGNAGTSHADYAAAVENPDFYHRSLKKLTDIIVHDIFSPPQASRIYAYPNIAAYEVLAQGNPDYRSMAGQLHDLPPIPAYDTASQVNLPLAAIEAFTLVGKALIFSEEKMEAYRQELEEEYKALGVPSSVRKASKAYGLEVASHILAWSNTDNYKETRTFPQYSVTDNENGRWTPTPPDYMAAIEPHWNKIRPFIIDSATQFVPPPPTAYDLQKNSGFMDEVREVYEAVNNLDEERTDIAQFWDCNPYVSHHQGHVMFATKKITPGGHWMGITYIATQKAGVSFMETSNAYARASISLADAFISCWDEKYRSNLIRPETIINEHIDESWRPLLQTPPFPEYTSGHSVISSAAAITLTEVFGDSFDFVDSTEVEYGLPPRSFDSFLDASSEAAISRLYGGIHYMPAIVNGVEQGKKVGNYVVEHLETRVSSPTTAAVETE
ncbi:MAG: vanadium-dependent haloperoxidase [Bacteroidota bacterium]